MADEYVPGDNVPSSFDAGIVAASYFASLCGCLLTVEILHRRGTAINNLRSWLETIACAISMGLVGIWCMHFIGNRAIILGDGNPKIQLVYDSGFTILSVILPVAGLTAAFSMAEVPVGSERRHRVLVAGTGSFAGLSIVGMHYFGNFGITNYHLSYNTKFVVVSFFISVVDCQAVLFLFYYLREKWISAWWKRFLCAMALAGGVSAMHFTASNSCSYSFRHYNTDGQIKSRNMQVSIAGGMCGAAALLALLYLVYAQWTSQQLKRRSQKVMLASAIFDPVGRVLVTTDGVLPSREITDKYAYRTFDEDFDTAHPVFQWIYRVTHNWSAVKALVPNMKSHINARKGCPDQSEPSSSQGSTIYDAETYDDSELLFKEQFCTAAAGIASSLHLEIEKVGVLYDKIVETGTLRSEDRTSRRNTTVEDQSPSDVEAAMRLHLFGKGLLMFITKKVTSDEAEKLLNVQAGFRFANVQDVAGTMSKALQIPLVTVEMHLSEVKQYLDNLESAEKIGTWLSFFALVPKPHGKGFDVVVKQDYRDQLPDVQLLPEQPQPWHIAFLDKLDGFRVQHILSKLDDRTGNDRLLPHEAQFATDLRQAIITLILQFPQEWARDAKFWSRQLFAHYSQTAATTTFFAFTVIGDMHATLDNLQAITRIPRTFFEARHRCYAGSPDHSNLQQRIHSTFSPLFSSSKVKQGLRKKFSIALPGSGRPNSKLNQSHSTGSLVSRPGIIDDPEDHSSMYELVDRPLHGSQSSRDNVQYKRDSQLGGILVNSETVIDNESHHEITPGSPDAALGMGNSVNVTTSKPEVTFVDELVTVTKDRFLPALTAGFLDKI